MSNLLFINYELPPLGGGGGHANEQIARELVQQGHQVTILTSRFNTLPHREERFGFDVIRIPTLRRYKEKCSVFEMLIFLISSLINAPRQYRKIKPDFVISFFSIPCGPAAWWLNKRYKVPYAIALRGGDVPGFLPEKLATFHKLSNWLTRLIWKKAKAVTANSAGLADLAMEFYPNKKIEVIPNGVDERFLFDRLNKAAVMGAFHNLSKGRKVLKVLTVGRLNEQKKIERLIDSMGRIKAQQKVHLFIAGDGPKRKVWELQAQRLGLLNQSVFFLGWCDRDQLVHYYQEADVFTLASDFEGMPNVVLEAMASSLAIVATHAPGTVDLVDSKENGFLVDRNSLTDFDRYFLNLAKDKDLLQQLQKASYQKIKSYRWDRVARDFKKLSEV